MGKAIEVTGSEGSTTTDTLPAAAAAVKEKRSLNDVAQELSDAINEQVPESIERSNALVSLTRDVLDPCLRQIANPAAESADGRLSE